MATIEKRTSKNKVSYRAKVRIAGHQPRSATFDRKSDAVRWAEDSEHALLNGLLLPGEDIPRDDKSIKASVNDYLELMAKDSRRSRHTILTDQGTGSRIIDDSGS